MDLAYSMKSPNYIAYKLVIYWYGTYIPRLNNNIICIIIFHMTKLEP